MPRKPKLSVWNKKQGKMTSAKLLKTQKNTEEKKTQQHTPVNDSPLVQFVKNFDAQIRKAARDL